MRDKGIKYRDNSLDNPKSCTSKRNNGKSSIMFCSARETTDPARSNKKKKIKKIKKDERIIAQPLRA
jgi:hypothetical protein